MAVAVAKTRRGRIMFVSQESLHASVCMCVCVCACQQQVSYTTTCEFILPLSLSFFLSQRSHFERGEHFSF